jgi:acyl-CoA synthetase (AMP-forming)/AMP-acid ligase II
MAESGATAVAASLPRVNVADRLAHFAAQMPSAVAVASAGRFGYSTISFAELDADATRVARGLIDWGVTPGTRLALLVTPGIEFVTLVFALLRAGVVIVLVDPGIGRKNLIRCLEEAQPEGFVAVPKAHAVRMLVRHKFAQAHWNVTVGRRWFWGGVTLEALKRRGKALAEPVAPKTVQAGADSTRNSPLPTTRADDPAAIIFTSGSTGPPKGVLYTHGMFDAQVAEIQLKYSIQSGGIDLACFPLFALFNSAMGVTTVLPRMDFSRPASAGPQNLLAAANDWKVTQAFASPAVWRNLSAHCHRTGERIETLREIFSCGAPVPADVLRSTLAIAAPLARMHTPYGATECLPVATIEATEVLGETAARTDEGAGVCVGRKFDSIDWRVIRITDEPIASIDDVEELPVGEVGELIVRGPQASPRYVTRMECNAGARIESTSERVGPSAAAHGGEDAPARLQISQPAPWHRMGDVGYFDEQGRFWYCGRKSHRVETRNGPLFSERIEGVYNSLPGVRRSALVGIPAGKYQDSVVIIEPTDRTIAASTSSADRRRDELIAHWHLIEPKLDSIWYAEHGYIPLRAILFRHELPVDIRHNAKINRELLAEWAAMKLPELA